MHAAFLLRRTACPDTCDDPRYWTSRTVSAMQTRWKDFIVPAVMFMSASYSAIVRKQYTGVTEEDLIDLAVAWVNERDPQYVPGVPGTAGRIEWLSCWRLLRNCPRFSATYGLETPAGRAEMTAERVARRRGEGGPGGAGPDGPAAAGGGGGVPGGKGGPGGGGRDDGDGRAEADTPSRASAGSVASDDDVGDGEKLGSKRAKEKAELLQASAAMKKRLKTLTDASQANTKILKNMRRHLFSTSAAVRGTPDGVAYLARTAALLAAEEAEDVKVSAAQQAAAIAQQRKAAEETRWLATLEAAKAQAVARRATNLTSRQARAAEVARAAAQSLAAAPSSAASRGSPSPRGAAGGAASRESAAPPTALRRASSSGASAATAEPSVAAARASPGGTAVSSCRSPAAAGARARTPVAESRAGGRGASPADRIHPASRQPPLHPLPVPSGPSFQPRLGLSRGSSSPMGGGPDGRVGGPPHHDDGVPLAPTPNDQVPPYLPFNHPGWVPDDFNQW